MRYIKYLIIASLLFYSTAWAQFGIISGGGGLPACSNSDYTTGTSTTCAGTPANAAVELAKKAAYDKSIPFIAASGVDTITADYTPNVTLADGVLVSFRSAGNNTSTTPSFAPDGLTARTIVKQGGAALVAGDIGAAGTYTDITATRAARYKIFTN